MISIVMPTYNQDRYLLEAVDSILRQTYTDFELIIVNDGSTDRTKELLDCISDRRVRVVHKENGGTGSALNRGFMYATGQYETWFPSDNVMLHNMLECLSARLNSRPGTDFVYGGTEIRAFDANDRQLYKRDITQEVGDQTWNPDRFLGSFFIGVSWLWRRTLRIDAGELFQEEPTEDYDMCLRMMAAGGKFEHMPEILCWHRRHPANISAQIKGQKHDWMPTPARNRAKVAAFKAARDSRS